jgi:hypothetical protein
MTDKKVSIEPGQALKSRWFVRPGEAAVMIAVADMDDNELVGIRYTREDVEAMLEAIIKANPE